MKYRPLNSLMVVSPLEPDAKSQGGIVLHEKARGSATQQATVLEVGPGWNQEDGTIRPLNVKVGETVLIGKSAGVEVDLNGKPVRIIRESDVLAVVE